MVLSIYAYTTIAGRGKQTNKNEASKEFGLFINDSLQASFAIYGEFVSIETKGGATISWLSVSS